MDRNELLIFGAGRHAVKTMETARELGMSLIGFISTEKPGTMVNNYPVLGHIDFYNQELDLKEKYFHIAIGENSVRYHIYCSIRRNMSKMVSLLDASSTICSTTSIQKGTYISKQVILQNHSNIGKCCLIDTGVIIEHDVTIGDFVTISPGAIVCGGVNINKGSIIGAGATVIEKVNIGENSLIGAGSVVINDIEPNVVALGNPAQQIKKRKFEDRYLR